MSLHAGAATRDITPAEPTQLCGYPHARRISTGTHDSLLASALFLSDGGSSVLLCALDLLMLNCDVARRIRRSVAEALGVGESGVLISCTHTHSAPVTLSYLPWSGDIAMPAPEASYLEFVEERIVEAAVAAQGRAQSAELAWSSVEASGVGGNRHSLDGPTDPEAGVLAVHAGNKLLAVALIYGMHPTVLHEDSKLIAGDFPYFARLHLQEAIGRELVVLYHTGAAGDQSPRYHVNGNTFAEAERLGRKLGSAVLAGLRDLKFTGEAALSSWLEPVELAHRKLPSVSEAEQVLATYRNEYERLRAGGTERARLRTAEVAVFGAEALLRLAQAQECGEVDRMLARLVPFEVQVLRIGESCVIGLPGEFFAEYSLLLKQRASAKSYLVTYANGELQGYIVTPEAAAAGGYEATNRLFEPEAGMAMVNAALAGISALMRKKPEGVSL